MAVGERPGPPSGMARQVSLPGSTAGRRRYFSRRVPDRQFGPLQGRTRRCPQGVKIPRTQGAVWSGTPVRNGGWSPVSPGADRADGAVQPACLEEPGRDLERRPRKSPRPARRAPVHALDPQLIRGRRSKSRRGPGGRRLEPDAALRRKCVAPFDSRRSRWTDHGDDRSRRVGRRKDVHDDGWALPDPSRRRRGSRRRRSRSAGRSSRSSPGIRRIGGFRNRRGPPLRR